MTNIANDHPDFEIDFGDTFAMDSVTTAAGAEQAYLYQRQFFDIVGNSAPVFLAVGNHEQQEAWHLDDTSHLPRPARQFLVQMPKRNTISILFRMLLLWQYRPVFLSLAATICVRTITLGHGAMRCSS